MGTNLDDHTAQGFDLIWKRYSVPDAGGIHGEAAEAFDSYFSIFPLDRLAEAEGFDLGCGNGRIAVSVAPRAGFLHCIGPVGRGAGFGATGDAVPPQRRLPPRVGRRDPASRRQPGLRLFDRRVAPHPRPGRGAAMLRGQAQAWGALPALFVLQPGQSARLVPAGLARVGSCKAADLQDAFSASCRREHRHCGDPSTGRSAGLGG